MTGPRLLGKNVQTFVRPLMEYCTTVWSPQNLECIKNIERVQRRFTKRFPGLSEIPYLQRLQQLNLDRLELRRIRFDLCMTYTIVKGANGLAFEDFFCFSPLQRTTRSISNNSLLLHVPKKGLNVRSHYFAERSIKYWNYLSDYEVNAPSIDSFKARLHKVDVSHFCLVSDF